LEIYSTLNSLNTGNLNSSSLTIGTFDGMHLGHQHLIKVLTDYSFNNSNKSVVITFSPNPYIVINNKKKSDYHLSSNEEKYTLLEKLGVDLLFEIKFDSKLSKLSAKKFLKDFIISPFNPRDIIIGYDHHFGYNREGNDAYLKSNSKKYRYNLHTVDPYQKEGATISSSLIRRLLLDNKIKTANSFFGRRYRISGEIVKGDNVGQSISFPTANLEISTVSQLIPSNGVYFVNAYINSDKYIGMCNIGYRPTVSAGKKRTIETHLFNFDQFDLYGQFIEIEFVDYVRSEVKFENKEQLKEQLVKDEKYCKSLIIWSTEEMNVNNKRKNERISKF